MARKMAIVLRNVNIDDLVQSGVLGLLDAAQRFDETRGTDFEAFASFRIRGAMIDALRQDAWPRDLRLQRRTINTTREALCLRLGHDPSTAELAAALGYDEQRLIDAVVRIQTIEAAFAPLVPYRRMQERIPDSIYEKVETRLRVRAAIRSLPWRERLIIKLSFYDEVSLKQIGIDMSLSEARVFQLRKRAIGRLREALK